MKYMCIWRATLTVQVAACTTCCCSSDNADPCTVMVLDVENHRATTAVELAGAQFLDAS